MPRYIDADELDYILEKNQSEAKFENRKQFAKGIREARRIILNFAIDNVQEVKHGQWIVDRSPVEVEFRCSECGFSYIEVDSYQECDYNYCPRCGAKMDGREDE